MLEGTLTLLIEDEPRELRRGDLARVGPEVRRQLANQTAKPLLLLAIGGAQRARGPRRARLRVLGRDRRGPAAAGGAAAR